MDLLVRIEDRTAVVGIVGLGYVGLPLILCFAEKGFTCLGLDIDAKKTEALMRGESYIKHIPAERIQAAVCSGKFTATTDFSRAGECDAILIAVPTPLNKNREPDVQYIVSSCEAIAPYMRKGQLVVLESSTYPGTTDGELREVLEPKVAEWAACRMDAAGAARLREQAAKLKQAAAERNFADFYEHDIGFHRVVWELSGNEHAARALESVVGSLFACGMRTAESLDLEVEYAKHDRLLRALVEGRPSDASILLSTIAGVFRTKLREQIAARAKKRSREPAAGR